MSGVVCSVSSDSATSRAHLLPRKQDTRSHEHCQMEARSPLVLAAGCSHEYSKRHVLKKTRCLTSTQS
jgi:hypothetical protein